MINKTYLCTTTYYSYFSGMKNEVIDLGNDLIKAFNEYKRLKYNEFDYGDAFYSVNKMTLHWIVKEPFQRSHTRTKEQWERINNKSLSFSEEEIKYLLTFINNDDSLIE